MKNILIALCIMLFAVASAPCADDPAGSISGTSEEVGRVAAVVRGFGRDRAARRAEAAGDGSGDGSGT